MCELCDLLHDVETLFPDAVSSVNIGYVLSLQHSIGHTGVQEQ